MHEAIQRAANDLQVQLDALDQASNLAARDIKRIREVLCKKFPYPPEKKSPIDVIFLGSYGRGEATKGSDRDYLIILDGTTKPSRAKEIFRAVEGICDELNIQKAGRGGLFQEFVSSAELYTRIGLDGDTNTNTSRRLLLLTESVSAYCEETRLGLIETVVDRYCTDYDDDEDGQDPGRVPHFLLNDLTRYWRTITVDFGAKKWRALAPDWHVRYAKLRTSRKLMYASTLASLFLAPVASKNAIAVKEHLLKELRKPVLARLCDCYTHFGNKGRCALKDILLAYNRFLEILNEQGKRDLLAKGETSEAKEVLKEMKLLGDRIQEGLEVIFYDEPIFSQLTRRYGLF